MTKKLPAVTIVEALVYIAIFGLIFTAVIQFVIGIRDNNLMAEHRADMEKSNMFLMNHLNSSFSVANSINTDNSLFDSDAGKVSLSLTGKYLQYELVNSSLVFNDNGVVHNITNPDFPISKFYLEEILNNGSELKGIRLEMEISSIKETNVRKTINTSFILR